MPKHDETKPKFRKLSYLIWSLVALLFCFGWLILCVATDLPDGVRDLIANALGVKWQQLPLPIFMFAMLIAVAPGFIAGGLSYALIDKFEAANRSIQHVADLAGLDKARKALTQGLKSVDKIEKEYRTKIAAFERVQAQLDELQSVRDIDTQTLQKKLNAIAYASRRRAWAGKCAAYILGIATSLFTSYLWEAISKG